MTKFYLWHHFLQRKWTEKLSKLPVYNFGTCKILKSSGKVKVFIWIIIEIKMSLKAFNIKYNKVRYINKIYTFLNLSRYKFYYVKFFIYVNTYLLHIGSSFIPCIKTVFVQFWQMFIMGGKCNFTHFLSHCKCLQTNNRWTIMFKSVISTQRYL